MQDAVMSDANVQDADMFCADTPDAPGCEPMDIINDDAEAVEEKRRQPKKVKKGEDCTSAFFSGMINTFHMKKRMWELRLTHKQLLRMIAEFSHDNSIDATLGRVRSALKKLRVLQRDEGMLYVIQLNVLLQRLAEEGLYDARVNLPLRSEEYNSSGVNVAREGKKRVDPEFAFANAFANTYAKDLLRFYDSFEKAEMEAMVREYVRRGGADVSFERVEKYLPLLDGFEYAINDGKAWCYVYYAWLRGCLSSMVGFDEELFLVEGMSEFGKRRRNRAGKFMTPAALR